MNRDMERKIVTLDNLEHFYGKLQFATKDELTQKQDTINDLETIRQGAAKGATALQSYTEQYKGTVTGVNINGTTNNPSSGIVDLGYINKQLTTSTSSSMTLSPNIYYRNTSTSLSTSVIELFAKAFIIFCFAKFNSLSLIFTETTKVFVSFSSVRLVIFSFPVHTCEEALYVG